MGTRGRSVCSVAAGVLVLAVGAGAGCGSSPEAPTDAALAGDDAAADGPDDVDAPVGADADTDGGGGDVVVVAGGPWPDSATGSCADGSGVIACPARGAALYGQDGTYRIAVPSYTTTAETVVDTVTSLEWERAPAGTTTNQADAAARCDALSLGGHDDWRLPARLELVSVLDHGRTTGGALPMVFGAAGGGAYWTSSTSGTSGGVYFVVNLTYGLWTLANATNTLPSRCVRGTALTGTRQVGADTVVDTLTGLEWQRSSLVDTEVSWADALSYCQGLVHAGHDDWRLPNLKELATIVDEADATAPVVDQAAFGTSAATHYWSSTPSFLFAGYANALQTDLGVTPNREMAQAVASARCVR